MSDNKRLKKATGVLLLGYGAPDSIEAIEPFLTNLMEERRPLGEQLEKIKERYRLIGGESPLLEITQKQARALEETLGEKGVASKVYVGMRYWHPLIEETVDEILAEGVKKIIALSLSPHYSRTTTGAYFKELDRVIAEKAPDLLIVKASDWYTHPLFSQAIAEKIQEGMEKFSEDIRSDIEVVFSAHSLPKRFVEEGDSYVDQLQETLKGVLTLVSLQNWRLAYQSSRRGTGEEWLGPDIETVLEELAKAGRHKVLLVPIGFTADHIETLYDIDIALRQKAFDLGLDFHRTAALNDSSIFIAALADVVLNSLVE